MPENCDATCVKIIIDTGMGSEAARLYASVLQHTGAGVRTIDLEIPLFYARVVENVVKPAALELNRLNLKTAQQDRLDAAVQEQCYRAEKLSKWAHSDVATITEKAAEWTALIEEWQLWDQAFYTELAAELGHKKTAKG